VVARGAAQVKLNLIHVLVRKSNGGRNEGLSVYVSSDYGGYLAFAGDGTVKRVNYPSS